MTIVSRLPTPENFKRVDNQTVFGCDVALRLCDGHEFILRNSGGVDSRGECFHRTDKIQCRHSVKNEEAYSALALHDISNTVKNTRMEFGREDIHPTYSAIELVGLVPAGGDVAVGGGEAEGAGGCEEFVEVEADGGAGELGDFVFDGQVEVVGAVEQAFEGALVLGEDGGADAGDVVEVNAAEGEVAEVLGGGDLDAAELGEVRLVGPAEEAGERAVRAAGGDERGGNEGVLEGSCAFEVLDALFDGFVEADDHGGGGAQAGLDQRALGGEVFGDGVLEFAVAAAEVLGQNLRAAAGDPANASLFEPLGCRQVAEVGVVGEVHEFGDGERVELQAFAVALADGAEEIAVVIERKMGVEAAIEADQVAAHGQQFIQFGEHLVVGEDVAALLPGQLVEGAVVALGDAHVGVVDDAHYQVGAGSRIVETRPHLAGERAHVGVARLPPEGKGAFPREGRP